MNESISRAAGAMHGQEMTVAEMHAMAASLGRQPLRRTTLYGEPTSSDDSAELWVGEPRNSDSPRSRSQQIA
jgi:FO synthase